jgi:dTDP-4-dehydrorhamnose reductase
MRLLVTGAGGQMGTEVRLCAERAGDEVIAVDHSALDVADRDAVLGALTTIRPDAVVNSAAWSEVDACEGDPSRAYVANALSVRWLAEGCRRAGAHLVHLSTDYVFSGDRTEPYTEWDEPGPLSVYGHSKLAGEREAALAGPAATVVRTSWILGQHGRNLLTRILAALDTRPTLSYVDDQASRPTLAADLAPVLRRLASERRLGVVHATGAVTVSRFELVRAVAVAAGMDPTRVLPIKTADLDPAPPARRPAYSALDNAVLRACGGPLLPDFRIGLPAVVAAIRGG